MIKTEQSHRILDLIKKTEVLLTTSPGLDVTSLFKIY